MENISAMNGAVVSTSTNDSMDQNFIVLERTLEQFQVNFFLILIFSKNYEY